MKLVSDSCLKIIRQPLPFSLVFLWVIVSSANTFKDAETQGDLLKLLLVAVEKKILIAVNQVIVA